MRKRIEEKFDKTIRENPVLSSEVKEFLLRHERKDLCIQNIHDELSKIQYTALKMDIVLFSSIIEEFATLFIKAAVECKLQEMLSSAEVTRRQLVNDREQELKKEFEEAAKDVKVEDANIHTEY